MHFIDERRPVRPRARARALAGALLSMALVSACTGLRVQSRPEAERDVLIGGLFSLSGSWSTLGTTGKAAMELAVDDVNRYLAGNPAHVRFVAAIEDTKLDPALALAKAQMLRARGAQLLIGPQSSAEVAYLKPFVDANDLFLVSPSSTAGNLALPSDNIFRFTPSDSLESVAVSALMWNDGIRTIVPVWRDDAGSGGLQAATRAAFGSLGGTVLGGVRYPAGNTEFAGVLSTLRSQVRQAVAQRGAGHVAVYLAGFDEVVTLFATAGTDPVLGGVRWYGNDALAQSQALLANSKAVDFVIRVGFPNPLVGLEDGARDVWMPLAERIRARTGLQPDAFALSVYDAVWVVARGYIASGATAHTEQLKRAFTMAAETHFGATGWTVLNAAGDRKYGDFDFWAVRKVAGVPRWVRVAQFETRTGRLFRQTETPMMTSSWLRH